VNRATIEQDSSMNGLLDIVFMLDKKSSREDMAKSLNTAMTCIKQMSAEDSADMYDWIDHVWLGHIDKAKKAELMKNIKRGEVSVMNSGLSLIFEEERLKAVKETEEKAEKKFHNEKIKLAKKMKKRGIAIEYIIEDTGLTVDEINE